MSFSAPCVGLAPLRLLRSLAAAVVLLAALAPASSAPAQAAGPEMAAPCPHDAADETAPLAAHGDLCRELCMASAPDHHGVMGVVGAEGPAHKAVLIAPAPAVYSNLAPRAGAQRRITLILAAPPPLYLLHRRFLI